MRRGDAERAARAEDGEHERLARFRVDAGLVGGRDAARSSFGEGAEERAIPDASAGDEERLGALEREALDSEDDGFRDEEDIDFNLSHKETGADHDWRWGEQWLPHASWFLLAVATRGSVKP